MKRKRFNTACIASSRGNYVRKTHYVNIQLELSKRGVIATLKDIIDADITISLMPKDNKYIVMCFGHRIEITAEEARMLDPKLVIKL